MSIPEKYIPKVLSSSDRKKQKSYIEKSRDLYNQSTYYDRPKVNTFKSKSSNHLRNVERVYGINSLNINAKISERTKCKKKGLEKIVNKGRGAYYSSGSRPNQTAESWGIARLASSITGGPASTVDYHILDKYCKSESKALKMAKKTCRKMKKCKKYLRNKTKKK